MAENTTRQIVWGIMGIAGAAAITALIGFGIDAAKDEFFEHEGVWKDGETVVEWRVYKLPSGAWQGTFLAPDAAAWQLFDPPRNDWKAARDAMLKYFSDQWGAAEDA